MDLPIYYSKIESFNDSKYLSEGFKATLDFVLGQLNLFDFMIYSDISMGQNDSIGIIPKGNRRYIIREHTQSLFSLYNEEQSLDFLNDLGNTLFSHDISNVDTSYLIDEMEGGDFVLPSLSNCKRLVLRLRPQSKPDRSIENLGFFCDFIESNPTEDDVREIMMFDLKGEFSKWDLFYIQERWGAIKNAKKSKIWWEL